MCDECHEDHEYMEMEMAVLGQEIRDFSMKVFDPEEGHIGEISTETVKEEGKWLVLFFYPADFTFVCPTELADLAEQHEELKKLGCEVVSVSTDTEYAHLAWKQSERMMENVRFKMGADPTGRVSRYFGVYDHEAGLALRGTFVVNPEGVLVSSEVNYYNVGRNAAELARKIKANVYLKDHPAEACPARWEPGKKTLTPSEELVGKVYESLID